MEQEDTFAPVKFKRSELDELELMVRRQGYKSIREMLLDKAGLQYVDNRRTLGGARSAPRVNERRNEDGGSPLWQDKYMMDLYFDGNKWVAIPSYDDDLEEPVHPLAREAMVCR